MDILTTLSKDHKKWLNIAKQFGGSEDDVQDMYIKVSTIDKEISTSYVWCILRSICVDKLRIEAKYKHIDLNDVKELVNSESDIQEFITYDKIQVKIEGVKYRTHYSDVIILDQYFKKGLTMRKIAAKYNISLSEVFGSIKRTKAKIREEIFEDYEDFKNKEYERV
jgi:DNA-directed RNA polymerase specialized sigma subunit